MNTVVARNNGMGRRRRRNKRVTRRQRVVVVQAPGLPRRGRRQRRNRRRASRGGRAGGGRSSETFVLSKDNLAGSSSGSITFGPSLSEKPEFSSGILKAYHEYKIIMVTLEFISEASATSSGSIAYELDPHCKYSSLQSSINKFGITKNGSRSWSSKFINGEEWHDASEDQFRILYKGNGASSIAGSFRITFKCQFQNPK
nr:coat protein [Phasey bean mild yellows virus]QTJ01863.1 coat protein [Phasey bean mild yellows virus]QTJ01869.1 coat protein [Phasey bean mild yellows virus]QTJ01881.1 coat protein [Phasey bean mild yellows virus]QTJ01887.1 coat protein [Phasey bean mild yellows virus]